ncbi:Uncharacterised protein [Neisseria gonorrhoeae]|uniref:Uncharacterized protein n=1 Tax=Neisseria gonorrhoeae TaxID=485 RepID=A0A378VW12_NEIGO|nr:Uncharacterised protein [Neisseria gonorrhoeae]
MLLDQRDKLYQCRLLHQQQYGCRDGNRIVVADHPNRISVTRNRGTKLKFIGYDTLTKDSFAS